MCVCGISIPGIVGVVVGWSMHVWSSQTVVSSLEIDN